jgi:hypothetical protein
MYQIWQVLHSVVQHCKFIRVCRIGAYGHLPEVERNSSGRCKSLPSQSNTMVSSSVAAGDVIQLNPFILRPPESISPKIPAVLILHGK